MINNHLTKTIIDGLIWINDTIFRCNVYIGYKIMRSELRMNKNTLEQKKNKNAL